MNGFHEDRLITDVGAGNDPQAANQSSSGVTKDVSVEIRCDDDVVVLWLANQVIEHRIH